MSKQLANSGSQKTHLLASRNRPEELWAFCARTGRQIGREVINGPQEIGAAVDRLLARGPSPKQLTVYHMLDARTLSEIPRDPSERERAASKLEGNVMRALRHRLSPADRDLYRRHQLEVPDKLARFRIEFELDEVIFRAAVTSGPRIFLSPVILNRVNDWMLYARDGAQRFERLCKCFVLGARVLRGQAKVPLSSDSWWVGARKRLIRELRVLRNFQLARSSKPRYGFKRPGLWASLMDTLEDPSGTFPTIEKVGPSLVNFVETHPEAAQRWLDGDLTPALFANEFIGWCTNRSPEATRQTISKLSRKSAPHDNLGSRANL